MQRLGLVVLLFLAGSAPVVAERPPKQAPAAFSVVEATIPEMRSAMEQGRTTSREIVLQSLVRIALYEDRLNAVMTVNANALREAEERDRERAQGRIRGPLHGIPIALKDNIHTTDMPTTGGALAFEGFVPPYEATLVKNLPRRDPREATADGRPALGTGGSSSGIGTAASFWAANVGTETSGSILSPANQNMLVGIKPTVGRVSRHGVIPITADQDTPGPMARSVTDAAILLGVLEGGAPDPDDSATSRCAPPAGRDYTRFLNANGLKGARIGIPRTFFYAETTPPGAKEPRGGLTPEQSAVMTEAIAILRQQGATVVDPAEIPSVVATDASANAITWSVCRGLDMAKGKDAECSVVFKYGMKRDFNLWLESLGASAPVKTLGELRQWNVAHQRAGAIKYGQAQLDISDEMDVTLDRVRYEADRAKDIRLSGPEGIDAVMKEHALDAVLFPGASGAAIAARPGYPTVIVPFGMAPNAPPKQPFPEGFDAKPAPLGVSFTGMACSGPRLIDLAYAFEQATRRRRPPAATP